MKMILRCGHTVLCSRLCCTKIMDDLMGLLNHEERLGCRACFPRSGRRHQKRLICLAMFWVDFKTNDNVSYDKPKQVACGKLTAA